LWGGKSFQEETQGKGPRGKEVNAAIDDARRKGKKKVKREEKFWGGKEQFLSRKKVKRVTSSRHPGKAGRK